MLRLLKKLRANSHREGFSLKDFALLNLGCALFALSYVLFFTGNQVSPGGIAGLAVIVSYSLPLQVGMLNFLFNLPIFILGLRMLGFKCIGRTIYVVVVFSVFADLGASLLPLLTENLVLVLLLGGALEGVGLGMIYRLGGSSGGTSLLGLLVEQRFPRARLSVILVALDAAVVLLSFLSFGDVRLCLVSLGAVAVCGFVIDQIIEPDGLWSRFRCAMAARRTPFVPAVAAAIAAEGAEG